MLLLAEYWGGAQIVQEKNRESFLLSKNVCWCWLRMLLLAEYVPATMLDPKALGTASDVHWQLVLGVLQEGEKKQKVRMELHILTFIEQCSGLQGRRRCLAAGVLDIWHGTGSSGHGTEIFGTARIHQILARHGTGHPCVGSFIHLFGVRGG